MPLYEYQCDACGHRFERIQKFSDSPLTACPQCTGVVRKLVSSPAIQFKGTGWYVTDYAKKKDPTASETDSSADAKNAKSDKTDAKSSASTASADSSKTSKKTGDSSASTSKSSDS